MFLTEPEFEGKAGRGPGASRMIAGLRKDQRALIKKLQPFGKPDHPLWVLAELDNQGKHRHAHILARLDEVRFDLKQFARFEFKTVEGVKPGRRYKEGAKVAVITQPRTLYNPRRIDAQVNMALERYLSVVFDQGSPAEGRDVLAELRRLKRHVSRVINQFRRWFPD